MPPTENNKPQRSKKQANQALKYSGMGMQMAISVFVGAMIGKKLDAYFQMERPICTAVLALVFLCATMYMVLRDLLRND
ncbi:MAG: F0F1-type ATP synthase assembly protein I [Polaribacter sp.]